MSSAVTSRAIAPFGVEIDADAVLNPSEAGQAELRRLFDEQGLIVVNGLPPLGMEEQKAICRLFGPVLDTPLENFIVSNVREDGYLGVQELLFHNDLPYLPMPYAGGSLHALDVSEGTTSTRFASAARAWDGLLAALREQVAGLNALHLKQRVFDRPNTLADMEPGDVCAVHAVVRRHDRTGRPYLFVNESMTGGIAGLPEAESDALLAELFAHLYAAGNVYEHRWRNGDLVIWDNLAVQHARGRVSTEPRTLQRVSIARIGYAQMYPTDLGIMGDQYADTLARGVGAATAR
jgi:taurine dioxygenase